MSVRGQQPVSVVSGLSPCRLSDPAYFVLARRRIWVMRSEAIASARRRWL